MAARSLTMKQIREILRLRLEVGIQSMRKIGLAVGVGKSAVADYLKEAHRLGVSSFEQVSELSEGDLEQLFAPAVIVKRTSIVSAPSGTLPQPSFLWHDSGLTGLSKSAVSLS